MLLTNNAPGVYVVENTFGPIPLELVGSRTMYLAGPALRGPLNGRLVTSQRGFHLLYGRRSTMTYLDDAVRAILETVQCPIWVCRVVGDNSVIASMMLVKDGVQQVETATVVGTIGASGAGDVAVVVTASGMSGSPITLTVAVANNDTASQVATKIRAALAANVTINAFFSSIGGTGAAIIATKAVAGANDVTLNISIANGTATGLTAAPTSVNTTPGAAAVDVIQIDAKGPGADYNFVNGPPKTGISVTYVDGVLNIFDYSIGNTRSIERFADVLKANAVGKAQEINSTSNLINITWLDPTNNPTNITTGVGLADGEDGDAVIAADVIGDEAAEPKTGLYHFIEPTFDPGYIMAPGFSQEIVGLALLDVATRSRKLAMIDSTFGLGANVNDLIAEKQQYASDQGYFVYVAQWLKAPDIDSGTIKDVPRSPYRAAHIVFSQSFPSGIANVGAGTRCVYPNVTGLEFDFDSTAHDILNQNGVDIPRNFARFNRGLVSFSARTGSANLLYRFNSVRTIFNVLTVSLERGLLDEIFQVIDGQGKLAAKIVARIEQLLYILWKDGVLFGQTPRDAYKVIAHMEDLVLIEQGILSFDVFAKPSPPLERMLVNLYRTALTVDLKNNTVFAGDIAVQ